MAERPPFLLSHTAYTFLVYSIRQPLIGMTPKQFFNPAIQKKNVQGYRSKCVLRTALDNAAGLLIGLGQAVLFPTNGDDSQHWTDDACLQTANRENGGAGEDAPYGVCYSILTIAVPASVGGYSKVLRLKHWVPADENGVVLTYLNAAPRRKTQGLSSSPTSRASSL
jgi:hypothetical protein